MVRREGEGKSVSQMNLCNHFHFPISDRRIASPISADELRPFRMSVMSASVRENCSDTKPKYFTILVVVTRPWKSTSFVPCFGKHTVTLPPSGKGTKIHDSLLPISWALMLHCSSNRYGPYALWGRISGRLLAGSPSNLITRRGGEMERSFNKPTQKRTTTINKSASGL